MAKYIRKPVIVDAAQWFPEVGRNIQGIYPASSGPWAMNSAGDIANPGDWCVENSDGAVEIYSPEEFQRLFEEVFPGHKEYQRG